MAALEVRWITFSITKSSVWEGDLCIGCHFFFVLISAICVGVRSKGLHRIRVEQCSASAAEGQHMYSRVPVHAAHVTPQQVSHIKPRPPPQCLCSVLLPCCCTPSPLFKGTVDKNQDIDCCVPSESSSIGGSVFSLNLYLLLSILISL